MPSTHPRRPSPRCAASSSKKLLRSVLYGRAGSSSCTSSLSLEVGRSGGRLLPAGIVIALPSAVVV
jgi:hypothetical protein